MKPNNKLNAPVESPALDRLDSHVRRHRALAMADLLARAAAEPSHVESSITGDTVEEGLHYIANDYIEELAALLNLPHDGERGGV